MYLGNWTAALSWAGNAGEQSYIQGILQRCRTPLQTPVTTNKDHVADRTVSEIAAFAS